MELSLPSPRLLSSGSLSHGGEGEGEVSDSPAHPPSSVPISARVPPAGHHPKCSRPSRWRQTSPRRASGGRCPATSAAVVELGEGAVLEQLRALSVFGPARGSGRPDRSFPASTGGRGEGGRVDAPLPGPSTDRGTKDVRPRPLGRGQPVVADRSSSFAARRWRRAESRLVGEGEGFETRGWGEHPKARNSAPQL